MERPARFEHSRFVGDKRTQLVYDLDEWDDPAPIEDLLAAETGICFGPDTLAEARNRGYTLAKPGGRPAVPHAHGPESRLRRERHLHVGRLHARPPPRGAGRARRAPARA